MIFAVFLDALLETGGEDCVSEYLIEVSLNLMFKGYDLEEILGMETDVLVKELRKPESPYGWNTVWGKKVVYG